MWASSTIFWVFGTTRPGVNPRSPGPLAKFSSRFRQLLKSSSLLLINFLFPSSNIDQTCTELLSRQFDSISVYIVMRDPCNRKTYAREKISSRKFNVNQIWRKLKLLYQFPQCVTWLVHQNVIHLSLFLFLSQNTFHRKKNPPGKRDEPF